MLFRQRHHAGGRGHRLVENALHRGNDRARRRAGRWWAAGGARRESVWRGAWYLLSFAHFRFGNHERPQQVVPVLEWLLEPDETSAYRPRVRLTAALPSTAERPPDGLYKGDPYVRELLDAALGFPDEDLRRRMADLMSVTDQPGLLDAVEREFRLRTRMHATYLGAAPHGHETMVNLWRDGEPTAFLTLVDANPNLPRPPADPDDVGLVLLALLKDRPDLLPAFDQRALVERVLALLGTWLPGAVRERGRRALRDLRPGSGVEEVCRRALLGDPEAVAAVRDAGHRPADAAVVPVVLLLTGQWSAYLDADPDGQVLRTLCAARNRSVNEEDVVIDRVLALLAADPPDEVAARVRGSLRGLAPAKDGPFERPDCFWLRRAVLKRATKLDPEAVAAVVDAGYLPQHHESLSPLAVFFLTGQFERYDHEDPDGTLLRAYLDKEKWQFEHEHFRTVAERAGRPDPWPPDKPLPPRDRSRSVHVTTWPSSFGIGGHF